MTTSSPVPDETPRGATAESKPVVITDPADQAADTAWQTLSEGFSESWLDDVRVLRTDGDDLDTSFDIWSVALIAALKQPERKNVASTILTRLRRLDDGDER